MQLTCEYLKEPLGVQNPKPRFAWRVNGEWENTVQVSYRVHVWRGEQEVWDSGEVFSNRSCAVEYDGLPLAGRQRYRWQVQVSLRRWSEPEPCARLQGESCFETGLLDAAAWQGSWIQMPCAQQGVSTLVRKTFTVADLPKLARIYISGLGYFEAYLNGKKIGSSVLDPGWTDYRKTVLYRCFDVTALLEKGENVLAVELGEGWYGHRHEGMKKLVNRYPAWLGTPRLLCKVALDDTCFSTGADGSWLCSAGAVRENSIYDGELYDARLEKAGWRDRGYRPQPQEWSPAVEAGAPAGRLVCQLMPSIEVVRELKPAYLAYTEDEDYKLVADFGENIAGWVQIRVKGSAGGSVTLRYGEVLNADGTVNQKNLRYARATDTYILGEQEAAVYHPRFTYHGFRYVQIEMTAGVMIEEVRAHCVHTAVERASAFDCDNELLNKIYDAMLRTEQNNLHSVPTDCPQRDERLGWINDMTVRFEEGLYNFDMALFYEKWLNDLADAQDPDTGAIPDTAPYFFGDLPASHISSVLVLLPWFYYQFYGDLQPLRRHYEAMKKYVAFKASQRDGAGLIIDRFCGEWAPPMTQALLMRGVDALPANIPAPIITTGYLYYDYYIMEKAAGVLGLPEEAACFAAEKEQVKEAVNRAYLNREEGCYGTNVQACNIFPLFLDIVPPDQKERVLRNLLLNIVDENQYHTTTGNQMTKYLYELLNREGLDDIAYRLAGQTTYPSLGFMLENGATTIWERWENLTGNYMNSHDHPMLGAFTIWFLKALGGIRDESGLAVGGIELRPSVPEGLNRVTAAYETTRGTVRCSWKKEADRLLMTVQVPWNAEARVRVPDGYACAGGERTLLMGPGCCEVFLTRE